MREQDLANADLFLFALYRLGGAGRYVDVEDVFMEMWRLAPARLTWRKYAVPNYKIASKAIVDISQRGNRDLLLGSGNHRQLSASGVAYVRGRLTELDGFFGDQGTDSPNLRPGQRVAVEAERSRLFQIFLGGEETDLNRSEIALFLRCAPDAPKGVWRERLETLRSAAQDGQRADLLRFLGYLESEHEDWFKEVKS
jgi:hypothetical protein